MRSELKGGALMATGMDLSQGSYPITVVNRVSGG